MAKRSEASRRKSKFELFGREASIHDLSDIENENWLVDFPAKVNSNLTQKISVTVSQLAVSFELERYLLSVFFQSYFPGMIMVILGGLSMFLDAKSVPARVSMGKLLKSWVFKNLSWHILLAAIFAHNFR